MKKDDLERRLNELLNGDQAVCASINGKWGVGKTMFWLEFAKEQKDRKFAYVSLFGKDSIRQIRECISSQIYPINKIISDIQDASSESGTNDVLNGLMGLSLGSAIFKTMGFFKKEKFKDTVVCFDDFERISHNLNLTDIFGVMSELKEQNECHIIIILNKDMLANKDELSKHKDKIVDYEFEFNPTPKDRFELVSNSLLAFKDSAINYFIKHNINNMRTIKRVINALNDHKFIEKIVEDNKELKEDIANKIISVSVINAMSNVDFNKLFDYRGSSLFGIEDSVKNPEFENLIRYIDEVTNDELVKSVVSYTKTSFVNKKELSALVEEMKKDKKSLDVNNELQECFSRWKFDFKYSYDEFFEDIYKRLSSWDFKPTFASHFISFVEIFKSDNEYWTKLHKLAVDKLKRSLNEIDVNMINIYPVKNIVDSILKFDNELKDYFDELIGSIKRCETSSDAVNIINSILGNRNFSAHDIDAIGSISQDVLKEYILNDREFVEISVEFIGTLSASNGFNGISKFEENFKNAIENLTKNKNSDTKNKAKMVLSIIDGLKMYK